MMMVAVVSLVLVAVFIPVAAIVGVVYAGWLAEQAERPRGPTRAGPADETAFPRRPPAGRRRAVTASRTFGG